MNDCRTLPAVVAATMAMEMALPLSSDPLALERDVQANAMVVIGVMILMVTIVPAAAANRRTKRPRES